MGYFAWLAAVAWCANAASAPAITVAAFDPVDATAGLQAAIRTKARLVRVPDTGKPWLVGPIELESEQEVFFEPGVVVMAKKGAFLGKRDSLFTATGKTGVVLRGYDASLIMRKQDYQAPPYEPSEWRHAVALRSVKGAKVLGLRISASGGDGVYVGRADGLAAYSSDVEIRDVTADDHHRQGISVVSVDGLLIDNVAVAATSGTAPAAGIDFEPNYPDERLTNVVVRDSRFDGNASYGLLFALMRLNAKSEPVSIRLENCGAAGNRHGAVRVDPAASRGEIVAEGGRYSGRRLLKPSETLHVAFP